MRLIFTNSNTIGSWLIRWQTNGQWSHVGIVDERNGVVIEAIWPKGVRITEIAEVKERSSEWAIYDVSASHTSADSDYTALHWAYSQSGKPYDTLGVLGIGFRRNWESSDKWWCSELVAKACLEAGINLINVPLTRITPEDIRQSPLVIETGETGGG